MKRMNNKGFTLVELIATIVLLALVMGIGAYSITAVIESSKEKDYELLVKEIKNSVELYYQECKYSKTDAIDCPSLVSGWYTTTLGKLVDAGFLKGNSTDSDDKFILVNPNDGNDISDCNIKYKYSDKKIVVEAVNPTGSCPTSY